MTCVALTPVSLPSCSSHPAMEPQPSPNRLGLGCVQQFQRSTGRGEEISSLMPTWTTQGDPDSKHQMREGEEEKGGGTSPRVLGGAFSGLSLGCRSLLPLASLIGGPGLQL